MSPAPAQQSRLWESCTLHPCLVRHPACSLALGQPWHALLAQHSWDLAPEKARMLSCEQQAPCYFCCAQSLALRSCFLVLCLDNFAGHTCSHSKNIFFFFCMTRKPDKRGAGKSQDKVWGSVCLGQADGTSNVGVELPWA